MRCCVLRAIANARGRLRLGCRSATRQSLRCPPWRPLCAGRRLPVSRARLEPGGTAARFAACRRRRASGAPTARGESHRCPSVLSPKCPVPGVPANSTRRDRCRRRAEWTAAEADGLRRVWLFAGRTRRALAGPIDRRERSGTRSGAIRVLSLDPHGRCPARAGSSRAASTAAVVVPTSSGGATGTAAGERTTLRGEPC